MRITGVSTHVVGTPWRNPAYVRVQTEEGLTGAGETRMLGHTDALVGYLREAEANHIAGSDPFAVEDLVRRMKYGDYGRAGEIVMSGIACHRVSQGSGVWMLTDAEISEMVGARAERNVEPCLLTGPRGTRDADTGTRTSSGGAGLRARGHDTLAGCVEDAVRATELGVRCLLVADESVPHTLYRLRTRGVLPAGTTLKVSALIGPVNPASHAVFERLGADSVNVPSGLSVEHPTGIRRVGRAPMDFHLEASDDLGGYVRMTDAVPKGDEPEVNDTESYDNGVKTVPAYLLEPVSIDGSNTQLLVDECYYTADQLK
ncbi:hypothetical protein LJ221_02440 [Streptomyces sp. CNQ085]|nr:hypothetical protein [Streptomyces sp. CNQ085]